MADTIRPFAKDRAERIATRLIAKFGSLANALETSPERLEEALAEDGDISQLILVAAHLARAGLFERVTGTVVDPTDPRLHAYLRSILGQAREERLCAIYVGEGAQYLADETAGIGTVGSVKVCQRELFRRALDLRAEGLILAHNHPSGDCRPSLDDVGATRHLAMVGAALGVRLIDHLIVSANNVRSMRGKF